LDDHSELDFSDPIETEAASPEPTEVETQTPEPMEEPETIMKLKLMRFTDDGETTLGALMIDGIFNCFIVEDQEQKEKVFGETRIPQGTYQVDFRKAGRFHTQYKAKYGDWHQGILCVFNAPNWKIKTEYMEFQYVLFHTGNTEKHTAGCLLPNQSVNSSTMRGTGSTDAYKKFYPIVRDALLEGKEVFIEIIDIEDGK